VDAKEQTLLVQARDLRKQYGQGKGIRAALDGVSVDVARGEFLAVVGPSGCGKSTLLGILGGLDRTYLGELELFGTDTRKLRDRELAELRGKRIGFVFQAFHLLGHLTALDNVLAPGLFVRTKLDRAERARLHARAEKLLGDLGLAGRGGDMPAQLSGGERQRVAIARALLMEPELLLCDEPTGNLDALTGKQIVEVFRALHRSSGITIVGVTHDELLTQVATRIVRLRHGRLVEPNEDGELVAGMAAAPPPEADAKVALEGEAEAEAEARAAAALAAEAT
jgi:putative ABC transport system ATP-binding protein